MGITLPTYIYYILNCTIIIGMVSSSSTNTLHLLFVHFYSSPPYPTQGVPSHILTAYCILILPELTKIFLTLFVTVIKNNIVDWGNIHPKALGNFEIKSQCCHLSTVSSIYCERQAKSLNLGFIICNTGENTA